jgi:hypothetical protein
MQEIAYVINKGKDEKFLLRINFEKAVTMSNDYIARVKSYHAIQMDNSSID